MDTKVIEKQMTIDDYLNNNSVAVLNTEAVAGELETLEAEPVDYNAMTKEELIDLLGSKDVVLANYEDKIEKERAAHKQEIENLNHFYSQRTSELNNLVQYYERKLKVLNDIINIELGGVK